MNSQLIDTQSSPTKSQIARDREPRRSRMALSLATDADRDAIYRIRHEVYAAELGQHRLNHEERLSDALDGINIYLVAKEAGKITGFISITPPSASRYSIDKYFAREKLPFAIDPKTYEVRLLTVSKSHRGREIASLLMYGAFRWVEAHGGSQIIAIGRHSIVDLYLRVGLELAGMSTRSGEVIYDLLSAPVSRVAARVGGLPGLVLRMEQDTDWQLSFPFRKPADCFHGGAFFQAVGERFESLQRGTEIINADVLDAWFPPAPAVLASLTEHLPWLLRTSPPTACNGLIDEIARARGVAPENILPGAGSSDLIFRALRHWLSPSSQVLILDPTYGEYAHLLERVIGCTTDRLPLDRADRYDLNMERLKAALADEYDLVVLVNPNSPTGRHIPRAVLEKILKTAPSHTRIWIDETYVDFVNPAESLEPFAAASENVVVCKSMSKAYALSGARVAYLCGGAHQLEALRAITPPWVVSLPAQLAAVRALQSSEYYSARFAETARLRSGLEAQLRALRCDVIPGTANFLLCHLPPSAPPATEVVLRCRARGLFLRDAGSMGNRLGDRAIRIAVKDESTNERMMAIFGEFLG